MKGLKQLKRDFTLGIIFEMSDNPLFNDESNKLDDRLSEFANPSEINGLIRSFKEIGSNVKVIDGPQGLLNNIASLKPRCDLFFNKSIGFRGLERKISVPAICQLYNLPLLGTSAYAMTLARHKFHTNRLLNGLSILVPRAAIFDRDRKADLSSLRFPVIVKPNHESDAVGISENSVCKNKKDALERAEWVTEKYAQDAIIEEFISGEEWKVSVIGNNESTYSPGIVGVMREGKAIIGSLQTRNDVISHSLDYYKPKKSQHKQQAINIATYVHKAMGLLDYSRTDFRIGEDGLLWNL